MQEKLSTQYNEAVQQIKTAILRSQAKALAGVNQEQLALYYGIGRYISQNTRQGVWGKDAIATISRQLSAELPGLRGFSATNLKLMRIFYEEWKTLETNSSVATDELQLPDTERNEIRQLQLTNYDNFPIVAFLSIGFSHHSAILAKAKTMEERWVLHPALPRPAAVGGGHRASDCRERLRPPRTDAQQLLEHHCRLPAGVPRHPDVQGRVPAGLHQRGAAGRA